MKNRLYKHRENSTYIFWNVFYQWEKKNDRECVGITIEFWTLVGCYKIQVSSAKDVMAQREPMDRFWNISHLCNNEIQFSFRNWNVTKMSSEKNDFLPFYGNTSLERFRMKLNKGQFRPKYLWKAHKYWLSGQNQFKRHERTFSI